MSAFDPKLSHDRWTVPAGPAWISQLLLWSSHA